MGGENNGKPYWNGWFWGTIIFGNTQVVVSHIFYFYPYLGGNDPIWQAYFSIGLVQPPLNSIFSHPPKNKGHLWFIGFIGFNFWMRHFNFWMGNFNFWDGTFQLLGWDFLLAKQQKRDKKVIISETCHGNHRTSSNGAWTRWVWQVYPVYPPNPTKADARKDADETKLDVYIYIYYTPEI